MGIPQQKSDFFSSDNVVCINIKKAAKVSISLRELLGVSDDINSLELVITDDLPVKLTFKNNFNITSLKNMVLTTINKLFLNPKDLNTGKPLDFRKTDLHSKQLDGILHKPKHVSFRKRISVKKKSCACSKCN